mmetsp:Transcript_16654/g.22950  ORF Transcript_16654/g.22950 Transcript_16654/m.22950 type:complete len:216 (-) Transcript_16654:102-749(-)|eukprot:CAMPEP_0196579504 /NCGR_PEP_ID=MMETSP1081-20130531/22043_1 /TAXON_ID=36882 /ORGANISM="Pyramimonas amylifera, Strain CCMP720" /LENGTH=215 /DNA_ID=CAMNT_0041899121 /DNA_START=20 /DNA_END=667 /DNA_ORIENTATION=+
MVILCDLCESKAAQWFCDDDDANLCPECDISLHESNPDFAQHQRVLLATKEVVDSPSSQEDNSEAHSSECVDFKIETIDDILKLLKMLDTEDSLDVEQFTEMISMDDIPRFETFVTTFAKELKQSLESVRNLVYNEGTDELIENPDTGKIRFHLHKMRGSSMIMGINGVIQACAQWSETIINNNADINMESHYDKLSCCVDYLLALVEFFFKQVS